MMMKRWRNGERRIPEWMAAGLLRLPGIVRTRRQQDIERWLAELSAQDREARDFIAAEEARLHGRVAAQVARYVPSVVRDPVKRSPPPRTCTTCSFRAGAWTRTVSRSGLSIPRPAAKGSSCLTTRCAMPTAVQWVE